MSAIAAVVGVPIACMGLTLQCSAWRPPVYTTPTNTWPAQPQDPTDPPTATSSDPGLSDPGLSGPTLAQPTGTPAGCQDAEAAITRYNNMVGATPYSEQQAAQRAAQDLIAVAGEGGLTNTIQEDVQALIGDFQNLGGYAYGPSSEYSAVWGQTQKNVKALNSDCGATG